MQKLYICSIFCLVFYSSIFAQDVDSIYAKVHLSNYVTSTLSTGIYSFESGKYIYQKRLFKNYGIQEYDTITVVEKKMLIFKKEKKALFINNRKGTKNYLEEIPLNAFEKEDTLLSYEDACGINKYFWKINPKPIILSCDILNIEIIKKEDSIYLLKLEFKKDAAKTLKKHSYKHKIYIYGLIINDNIIAKFNFRDIYFDYNNKFPTSVELEFKEIGKGKIEYFKSEILIPFCF